MLLLVLPGRIRLLVADQIALPTFGISKRAVQDDRGKEKWRCTERERKGERQQGWRTYDKEWLPVEMFAFTSELFQLPVFLKTDLWSRPSRTRRYFMVSMFSSATTSQLGATYIHSLPTFLFLWPTSPSNNVWSVKIEIIFNQKMGKEDKQGWASNYTLDEQGDIKLIIIICFESHKEMASYHLLLFVVVTQLLMTILLIYLPIT